MRARQLTSRDHFVFKVNPSDVSDAMARLSSLGKVEEIPGAHQILLSLGKPAKNPKSEWQRLLGHVRHAEWVSPLITDETGIVHFPTGGISVRFRRNPSEGELERFLDTHQVRVCRGNEFVPEQVTVEPLNQRGAYLPDLIHEISRDKNVVAVWAETLSRFRRT